MTTMLRWAVAIVLVMVAFLAGCSSDDDDDSSSAREPANIATLGTPEGISSDSGAAKSFAEQQMPAPQQAPDVPVETRQEVVTGSANVTTDDPISAAQKVIARVQGLAGRVDYRNEQPRTDDVDPSASLNVRVPAAKTDELVKYLHEVGTVASIDLNRADVTAQFTDLTARIGALQKSIERLTQLMTQTTNVADLISAESALSQRQAELDSLVAQKRVLDDQISLSSISIAFTVDPKDDPDKADSFWDGLVAGWDSLVAAIKAMVIGTGRALPWIGFVAIVGAVVVIAIRVLYRALRRPAGRGPTPPAAGAPQPVKPTPPSPTPLAAAEQVPAGVDKGSDQADS